MPLPPPRRRSPRGVVGLAVAAGVVAVVAAIAVLVWTLRPGDRPEEDVAEAFLEALFTGHPGEAHALTSPTYQALVFPADLAALSEALVAIAGTDPQLEIVGSERTPGSEPTESLVGYTGTTASGSVEGVVALQQADVWRVIDVSVRFPEAAAQQVAALQDLLDRLNAQVEQRLRSGQSPGL